MSRRHRYVHDALLSVFVFSTFAIVGGPDVARACESEKCSPRATCYEVRRGYKKCDYRCGLFTCSCRAGGGRCTKRRGDGERSTGQHLGVPQQQPTNLSSLHAEPASAEPACVSGKRSPWSQGSCKIENGLLLSSCNNLERRDSFLVSLLSDGPEFTGYPLGRAP